MCAPQHGPTTSFSIRCPSAWQHLGGRLGWSPGLQAGRLWQRLQRRDGLGVELMSGWSSVC